MKRMNSRPAAVLCALLLLVLLCVPTLADSGPKAQLIIRVKHAPDEPYYLDLLEEGEYGGPSYGSGDSPYCGIDWNYPDERADALDPALLDALRAAIPAGWHACTAQGTNGVPMNGQLYAESTDAAGNPLHVFSYMGVPERYRILMVTQSGQVFVSEPLERRVLQSSAAVDWAAKSVSVPPVWVGCGLQFLATLLPTLAVEGALAFLFGYRARKSWQTLLGVNLLTQGALALYLAVTVLRHGVTGWSMIFFLPAELVITAVECGLYCSLLTEQSKARAVVYGLCANVCSAAAGACLALPVWRWVVSIS